MRNSILKSLLGSFLVIATSSAQGAPAYVSITNLGDFIPAAINNHGQVTGRTTGPVTDVVLWDNGTLKRLQLGDGTTVASPFGFNDSGEIAGFLSRPGAAAGFIYSKGTLEIMPTLPGALFSQPRAINAHGDVVGLADFNSVYLPFLRDQKSSISLLPLLPGDTFGYAVGINDAGEIIGFSHPGTGLLNSFVYRNGAVSKIEPLLKGTSIAVLDLNNAGEAVGNADADISGSQRHAFYYVDGVTSDLGVPGGFASSQANAINANGVIVASAYLTGYGGPSRPFMYADGAWTDFNDLLPKSSGWIITTVFDINDAGNVVGLGTFHGRQSAFLLSVPDGGSTIIMLAAGLALASAARLFFGVSPGPAERSPGG